MPETLDRQTRLNLMKLVIAVIAADDETDSSELDFVGDLIMKLDFSDDDMGLINGWLAVPPSVDEIGEDDAAPEDRALMLAAIDAAAMADRKLGDAEAAALARIRKALR